MSLYPSLEDFAVDSHAKAQLASEIAARPQAAAAVVSAHGGLYANLGLEELSEYAGLDISNTALVAHMSQEIVSQMQPVARITPEHDVGIARASIKQGVREVILAKDGHGKVGLIAKAIDKGVFVAFVHRGSAAALGGLRFGDQILQINGETVAGWSSEKTMDFIKKADPRRISLAVRDRPYERTITLVKNSMNHVGFLFRDGEITALVKDSSAARNGLLINHQLVEVNGQNVVGLKDQEVERIFADAPQSITVTIMPKFIFDHIMKKIGSLKKEMDRSVPEY
eukprot:m.17146 g.17146  ORF g.17146 m.17146 type:complete len:283 (-) comp7052_c0_seq1:238-1086(-)